MIERTIVSPIWNYTDLLLREAVRNKSLRKLRKALQEYIGSTIRSVGNSGV